MSIKQLNRDFTVTFPVLRSRSMYDIGGWVRGDIETSMRDAAQRATAHRNLMIRNRELYIDCFADVVASVRDDRMYRASRNGVTICTTDSLGTRRRGARYHFSIMRYYYDPEVGWKWHCPLVIRHHPDLNVKGAVELARWKKFVARLKEACAEASIFAHAFRHGA